MSQRADTYTRWAVIASGEGGGRIASQFFTRTDNPGIEDRIVVMNTNRADIRNTIQRIESSTDIEDAWGRHAFEFGSESGAGNFWLTGERCATEDFDRIVSGISDVQEADAFLHVNTLGGGTGCGSIPHVVDQFKNGAEAVRDWPWMESVIHAVLAVWPYYEEPPQRQFNAICGLSRLFRRDDGEQNADMVLLAANSHLNESGDRFDASYDTVNERLIQAVDLMIGAGRETRGVIDVQDYVMVPSQMGVYHFTPAVATDLNATVMEPELLFDRAAGNAFVPLDVSTSKVAYGVVRAPERMIEEGELTETGIQRAFSDWKQDRGIGHAAGMTTVTPKRERGGDVDVLLLLGGFDLSPLLDHSWDQYEQYKQSLASGRSLGGVDLSERRLNRIEENLTEYVNRHSEPNGE